LDAFCAQYTEARPLLVGEGGVPIAEFLARPADEWITST